MFVVKHWHYPKYAELIQLLLMSVEGLNEYWIVVAVVDFFDYLLVEYLKYFLKMMKKMGKNLLNSYLYKSYLMREGYLLE